MRILITGLFLIFFPAISPEARTVTTPQMRLEKHFDINKDGNLDLYEQALIRTQRRFGWRLANTQRKRQFDHNKDWMLDPVEYKQYREGKKPFKR